MRVLASLAQLLVGINLLALLKSLLHSCPQKVWVYLNCAVQFYIYTSYAVTIRKVLTSLATPLSWSL